MMQASDWSLIDQAILFLLKGAFPTPRLTRYKLISLFWGCSDMGVGGIVDSSVENADRAGGLRGVFSVSMVFSSSLFVDEPFGYVLSYGCRFENLIWIVAVGHFGESGGHDVDQLFQDRPHPSLMSKWRSDLLSKICLAVWGRLGRAR